MIIEKVFDLEQLGKRESIMCQGNGCWGLRNTIDEFNAGEQRNLFLAGTFNQFDGNEVTELPNAADVNRLNIRLDEILFHLQYGKTESYSRELCLKTGEGVRAVVWESPKGGFVIVSFTA